MEYKGIINQTILVGIVDGEPDIRYFGYDSLQVQFRLHTQETITLRAGAGERSLDLWHQISVRGDLAKQVEQFVRSGSHLAVVGAIRYHRETDRFGTSRTVTEIEAKEIHLLHKGAEPEPSTPPSQPAESGEGLDWSLFAPSEGEDPMA